MTYTPLENAIPRSNIGGFKSEKAYKDFHPLEQALNN